jgi:putative ABC transport system substrate-binding protein
MRIKTLALIAAAVLGIVLLPTFVEAQTPGGPVRIGTLTFGPDEGVDLFLEQLTKLGYVEGQTMVVEKRHADGRSERLPELDAELVRLKVDLIFAMGTDVSATVKSATSEIPLVFLTSGDPTRVGLVQTFARPGGNATGVTLLSSELGGKRLELLKELRGRISRVGVLWNPDHPHYEYQAIEASARTLGVRLQPLQVRRSDDFEKAFGAAIKAGVEALVVVPTRLTWLHREEIADFGLANRIPTVSGWSEFADAGGLLTYGPDVDDLVRRAAVYADRLLKGAKPGDLPVEQPTKFELVINLKTARAIGITIPDRVLSRADRLIR